jgi:hypothetical protein
VFCARKITQLFSVVFCLVRAVLKLGFRIVTKNRTTYKWKQVHAAIGTRVFDWNCVFPPTVVGGVKGLYPRVQVNWSLLSKGQ